MILIHGEHLHDAIIPTKYYIISSCLTYIIACYAIDPYNKWKVSHVVNCGQEKNVI